MKIPRNIWVMFGYEKEAKMITPEVQNKAGTSFKEVE